MRLTILVVLFASLIGCASNGVKINKQASLGSAMKAAAESMCADADVCTGTISKDSFTIQATR